MKKFLCGILIFAVLFSYSYALVSIIGTGPICAVLLVVGWIGIIIGLSDLHLKF